MSEMKEMIVDVVEKIYKKHLTKETVDLVDEGKWAENVWTILENNNLIHIASSEQAGGAGGDLDDLLSLYMLIGKYAAPIPFVETTLSNYLLELVGLQISNQKCTYRFKDNHVKRTGNTIDGILYEVPWARHVDELITVIDDQLVHVSLSEAEIDTQSNLAGEPRDTVILKNTKVIQSSPLLTSLQKAQIIALETAAKNAIMSGALTKAHDLTVKYTKEREQFGRPIHRFQLVQQHLAFLAGEAVITTAAIENMISALKTSDGYDEVGYTRIRMDEAVKVITASAHQVHAAIGVTHEHSLHQYTRRLWSWRDEGYTVSYWKKELAKKILQSEATDIWTYITDSQNSNKPMKEAQNG